MILKKGEVKNLFNDLFYFVYDAWLNYHYGKELLNWSDFDLNQEIIDSIIAMEIHFENHFSNECVMIEYLKAGLRR